MIDVPEFLPADTPLPPKCPACPTDHGGMFPMGPKKPDAWECLSHATIVYVEGSYARYRREEAGA